MLITRSLSNNVVGISLALLTGLSGLVTISSVILTALLLTLFI